MEFNDISEYFIKIKNNNNTIIKLLVNIIFLIFYKFNLLINILFILEKI